MLLSACLALATCVLAFEALARYGAQNRQRRRTASAFLFGIWYFGLWFWMIARASYMSEEFRAHPLEAIGGLIMFSVPGTLLVSMNYLSWVALFVATIYFLAAIVGLGVSGRP
jgi:uncharacterized membrane protein